MLLPVLRMTRHEQQLFVDEQLFADDVASQSARVGAGRQGARRDMEIWSCM